MTDAKDQEDEFIPNPPELDGVPDLSMLTYLEMEHVLHNLEHRYCHMARKYCYTSISTILVAVNPYETLPIYGQDVIDEFSAAAKQGRLPQGRPHPYGVSARSYMRLVQRRTNQSIIVCGESGAGKTETTKLLMRYLALTAESASMEQQMVEQQIIAASPILEAYGNAKTILNNNSSRFGKFTKLLYDVPTNSREGHILGSYLETYLLEKSRVVKQALNERNYHIFYFLYHGLDDETKAGLQLSHPDDYHYTQQGQCSEVAGVNDVARFEELQTSMNMMGIDEELQRQLWELTIGILHLGNISFTKQGDGFAEVEPSFVATIETIANLWGITPQALTNRLLTASMKVNNKKIETRITFDNAEVNRDSIAKSLYENTFLWLCSRINAELFQVDVEELNVLFIGILDVFGFENFQNNSLEQFCINFTNEKLQEFFSYHIIQSEQEEYISESVFWTPLAIPDNLELISMVEDKKSGFFTILDGACKAPRPSVEAFMQELMKRHADNPTLKDVKRRGGRRRARTQAKNFTGFELSHFADTVVYNADMFLLKNMEAVHPDTAKMFKKSDSPLVGQIGGKSSRGRRKQSVTSVFAKALRTLMINLKETEPFFVRCVNPNKQRSSTVWDKNVVEHQLRCGGLVEALKVLKLGYPTRVPYDMLYEKYHSHVSNPLIKNMNAESFSTAILIAFDVSAQDYELGLTKIFFRPAKAAVLDAIMAQAGQPLTEEQNKKITKWVVMKRMRQIFGVCKTFTKFRRDVRMARAAETWEHVGRVGSILGSSCSRALRTARDAIRERKQNAGAQSLQVFWRYAQARSAYNQRSRDVKSAVDVIWKSYKSWHARGQVRQHLDAKVLAREQEIRAAEAAKAAQDAEDARIAENAAVAAATNTESTITATPSDVVEIDNVVEVDVPALDVHVPHEPEEKATEAAVETTTSLVAKDAEVPVEEEKLDLQEQIAAVKQQQDRVHFETLENQAREREREKRAKKRARDSAAKTNQRQRKLAEDEVREKHRTEEKSRNKRKTRQDTIILPRTKFGDYDDGYSDSDSDDEDDVPALTRQLKKFPGIARTGEWFLHYRGKRRSRTLERFVHVVYQENEPVEVRWGPGSRHIRLDEVKYISWGLKTPVFESVRGQVDPNKCFSLVGRSRSVDLCAHSGRLAELWVKGLRRMIRQTDLEAERLSDEAFRRDVKPEETSRANPVNPEGIMRVQRELFVMTHAAVFRQLEQERVWMIDQNVKRALNANVMYDNALMADIPWKQWSDWIRREIISSLIETGRVSAPNGAMPPQGRVPRGNSITVPVSNGHRVSTVGTLGKMVSQRGLSSSRHERDSSKLTKLAPRPKKMSVDWNVGGGSQRRLGSKHLSSGQPLSGTFGGQMNTRSAMAGAAGDDAEEPCVIM